MTDGQPERKTGAARVGARRFPIVGIGASAGGLEAFTQLLAHLPADTGMGFVLVQHLAPAHPSALAHLLSAATVMPVYEAAGKQRILPNHVYVITPSTALRMVHGVLEARTTERPTGVQHSIDSFLESLAADRQEQAIGVILSGNASDGTLGLEAIKAHGGVTFAQDDSAQYHSMPHSAIFAGCVDRILPPEGIALELARMARHPYVQAASLPAAKRSLGAAGVAGQPDGPEDAAAPARSKRKAGGAAGTAAEADFRVILRLVRNHSRVDFSPYKPITIGRRIARRMALHGLTEPKDYLDLLRSDDREVDKLYADLLICVTEFFRDPEAFEALRHEVFPALLRFARNEQPRIWVPGCSTGEEAYSLAMAFAEFSERARSTYPLQIFATDLNEALIDKARTAFYPEAALRKMQPERLRRFFIPQEGGGYRVTKELRERIVFARHNLLGDPPFSRMNLVSCRNLLIYLDAPAQARLIANFHYALRPDGFLFLGASESIATAVDLFQSRDRKHKIYMKRMGIAPQLPSAPAASRGNDAARTAVRSLRPGARHLEFNVQREADRVTVKRFAPPGVLINADGEILQFRGSTNPYLELPSHKVSFNVLDMARGSLRASLRGLIKRAQKEGQPVRRPYAADASDEPTDPPVNLEVIPLKNLKERHYLILFEPVVAGEAAGPVTYGDGAPRTRAETADPKAASRRLRLLEHELAEARDYAQALQEQYETANEELQTSNEEAQSANGELQSTNEQLETSKEEIDSANEELITLNAELTHRNVELTRLNDDLANLQASVSLPILVLGRDLRIRSFTPPAVPLFNLVATDVGQSLRGVAHRLDCPDLAQIITVAIDTVRAQERELRDLDGRWYLLRVQPYLTLDNKIDGAILVLVSIDALKRSALEARQALDYAEAMLRTARVPLVALHSNLLVRTANEAFYKTFGLSPHEVENFSIFSMKGGAWNIPELHTLLTEVLPREGFRENFQVVHEFPVLGRRTMWLNARRLPRAEGTADMIVLSIEDVTDQLKAREDMRRSEVRFRRLFETAQDGILILEPTSGRIVDANPFISELLGYSREELIGKEPGSIGLFRDGKSCHEALAHLRETGFIRDDHLPLRGKDGRMHVVEFVGNIYEEDCDRVIQCNIRDVTIRTRVTEALRASEARFHAIADNVPVMLWMRDADDRVTYFNQGWQTFVGGTDGQTKDDQWQAAIHPEDRARVLAEYAHAFADLKRFELKYRLRQHGGEYRLILDVGIPLIREGKSTGYIGTCIDITDRERVDAELSKSSKLESIGILAGGIAHDFNNLLTAIIGNIGLARLSLNPDGELFKNLMAAEYAGLRARDLAQQLLIFARGGAPIQNVVSLSGLLEEWLAFALRGSNIKITAVIAPDLWPVEADTGQLSQVINNLIINAQQAMPQGGVITVTAQNVTLAAGGEHPFTGDYVEVAITDQGEGIAEDHLGKIFDPFFTTKAKGTGLGLATSYTIVKKHNGHLTVRSERGHGATFSVYLPASRKEAGPSPDHQSVPPAGSGKILFMDDEPVIRQYVSAALAQFGYEVECAEDGKKAIEYYRRAQEQGAPYDGVILDLTVPGGMGGKETMQILRDIDPHVRAIVSSGYSNDPVMADFPAYGFCGRIVKPYQIDDLRRSVSRLSNDKAEDDSS
ncbi:MAG: PAS domain S-box protein [Gammaproteobacteria bacterium]|nr:PAS domain S-box protein [Gammaproteobacteria bacterium]